MPSRPACAAILLFWTYAAGALFRRDILPDLWTQPPPDLRTVAVASDPDLRTKWELSVAEDSSSRSSRSVGSATSWSTLKPGGDVELNSEVQFDSGNLLKGTPFAPPSDGLGRGGSDHVVIENVCTIDPSGNLRGFRAAVKSVGDDSALLTLVGRVVDKSLEVKAIGPLPMLNWTRSFPYESRGMIQNSAGATDRLPGLQVGQRWDTRVVSPLTGRVDTVRTEVTGRHLITWDNALVSTLMVVQHLSPVSAKTWVRADGLVLRQEVPFPFVKLMLERVPNHADRLKGGTKAP